jgi:hypothetical protein
VPQAEERPEPREDAPQRIAAVVRCFAKFNKNIKPRMANII